VPADAAFRQFVGRAVVREVTFVGEMHRYVVETEFGAMLTLKQQHRHGIRTPGPCRMP